MIDLDACLAPSHVTKIVGQDTNKQDIYEKYVHSMVLLEQLDTLFANKHYVFKGGTSLLLLFKSFSRFSIDIDICMEESEFENRDALELVFKNNIKSPFIDVVRDKNRIAHGGRDIKAAHYRFFYEPRYKTNEKYVLLDITFQNNSIIGERVAINSSFVEQTCSPSMVNTIGADELLGDKLTAFAPNTIGVKYKAKDQFGRPKCTEIIKQLYDCAYLSNRNYNLDRVASVYKELGSYQIKYEKKNGLNLKKCLLDTIKTCEILLSGGAMDKDSYNLLMEGMRSFNDYKINGQLTILDIQSFALYVDIITSKILKKLFPSTQLVNKTDYLIRTKIKEKELSLLSSKEKIKEFFDNCLISIE